MTIEEEFFKCFGIKGKNIYYCPNCNNELEDCWYGEEEPEYRCSVCNYETDYRCDDFNALNKLMVYPKITAEILLKLICIYTHFFDIGDNVFKDTKDLKNFIIQGLMLDVSSALKNKVKSLFERGVQI